MTIFPSGTYKPTDNLGPDSDQFLSVRQPETSVTNLAVFNGTNPNGTWELFIRVDDTRDKDLIVGGSSLGIDWEDLPPLLTAPTRLLMVSSR